MLVVLMWRLWSIMHLQERMLHDGADNNWRSAFFMPAQADTGGRAHSLLGGGVDRARPVLSKRDDAAA
jgi:hypothetical protein